MQRRLNAKAGELASPKQALKAKETTLKEKLRQYSRLKLALSVAWAAIGREKGSCRISRNGFLLNTRH